MSECTSKKKNYLGFPRFDPFCCNACLETVGFIEKDHKENKLINKSNPFLFLKKC